MRNNAQVRPWAERDPRMLDCCDSCKDEQFCEPEMAQTCNTAKREQLIHCTLCSKFQYEPDSFGSVGTCGEVPMNEDLDRKAPQNIRCQYFVKK
jgi:hypothetical protein